MPRRARTQVIPFFAFPPEVRRVIYTTNALESVHARLRKIIKTRMLYVGAGQPESPFVSVPSVPPF
jgi:transposase-like protein